MVAVYAGPRIHVTPHQAMTSPSSIITGFSCSCDTCLHVQARGLLPGAVKDRAPISVCQQNKTNHGRKHQKTAKLPGLTDSTTNGAMDSL